MCTSKSHDRIHLRSNGGSISGPPSAFSGQDWKVVSDASGEPIYGESSIKIAGGIDGNYDLESDQWFPTDYSATKASEWYAECFAIFVMHHLHGEPEAFFKEVIR